MKVGEILGPHFSPVINPGSSPGGVAADQLEAFKRIVDEGRGIEDVVADFGVTPLAVKRRLKLAVVSPRSMQAYREGVASLEGSS